MKAVIAAKTHMGQNISVGAVDADTGDLLRLIPRDNAAYHSWQEFNANIGDLIDLEGSKAPTVKPPDFEPPHSAEDVLVDKWNPTGKKEKDLSAWIRSRCLIWKGDLSSLFDGKLLFTSWGKGHIDRGDPLPTHSVGFWELPAPLTLKHGPDGKPYYTAVGITPPIAIKYVGVGKPEEELPVGRVIRLSLGRWWAPDDGSKPEACGLQISGWY